MSTQQTTTDTNALSLDHPAKGGLVTERGLEIASTLYAEPFETGGGGHTLRINVSWNNLVEKWKEWAQQRLRLSNVEVNTDSGSPRYSGVWIECAEDYALILAAGLERVLKLPDS